MQQIPLSSITLTEIIPPEAPIPEAEIAILAADIRHYGLREALTLRKEADGRFTIKDGRKRYLALLTIADPIRYGNHHILAGCAPFTLEGMGDPVREAAIYQYGNWVDGCRAIYAYYEVLKARAVDKGKSAPTVREVAEDLLGRGDGRYYTKIRKTLLIHPHLGDDRITSAPSLELAWERLCQIEKQANPKGGELELIHTHLGDWLADAPQGQFDVVLADLSPSPIPLTPAIIRRIGKLAKSYAHLYLILPFDQIGWAGDVLTLNSTWRIFPQPICYLDPEMREVPWVGYGPVSQVKFILYANHGGRPMEALPNFITPNTSDKGMATLFHSILRRSCHGGERILTLNFETEQALDLARDRGCHLTYITHSEDTP